jgi:hypothetical protein
MQNAECRAKVNFRRGENFTSLIMCCADKASAKCYNLKIGYCEAPNFTISDFFEALNYHT